MAWLVPVAVLVVFLGWWLALYNRIVRVRNTVEESWSDIDVELRRRYDLIPNLVETVRGYAEHEREVLERVVELRGRAMQNHGSAASQGHDEARLNRGMRSLFALAEGYPELKSDANFRALQEELALTEDRIAATRRFFNGNVRELRNLRETFPSSLVASAMGVEEPTYFELDDEDERTVPRVAIGS